MARESPEHPSPAPVDNDGGLAANRTPPTQGTTVPGKHLLRSPPTYPPPVIFDELPAWARELTVSARVGRLGFLDETDLPRVLPVTFTMFEGALWSAVDCKPKRSGEPARIRRLRRRPEATLLVDVFSDDWSRLAWLELRGLVTVAETSAALAALEALTAKYEQYRTEPPPGPLLRLTPQLFACWRASDRVA
jgi:PPOX class probable F420-dependent enzyme